MQIIPVLDLAGGIAVHARAGHRAGYQPVRSALAPNAQGDPVALLRGFRDVIGASVCYVADLDAIQGGPLQRTILAELAGSGPGASGPLLVDAGAHSPEGALELLACGASQVVVGLETLRGFADLALIVSEAGRSRVVFSLDLKLGRPILHPELRDADRMSPDPMNLAARAIDSGVGSVLVLDVGRVGTGCGVELALVEALRRRFPAVRLLVGGGIVDRRDLEELRRAGCAGALVASALHSGTLTADDVAALAGPLAGDQSPARA